MSNAALAPQPQQQRGAHARTTTPVQIRVIRGGLLHEETYPRHAKTRRLDGMRGINFDLTTRERICVGVFGALFALTALTVTLL